MVEPRQSQIMLVEGENADLPTKIPRLQAPLEKRNRYRWDKQIDRAVRKKTKPNGQAARQIIWTCDAVVSHSSSQRMDLTCKHADSRAPPKRPKSFENEVNRTGRQSVPAGCRPHKATQTCSMFLEDG